MFRKELNPNSKFIYAKRTVHRSWISTQFLNNSHCFLGHEPPWPTPRSFISYHYSGVARLAHSIDGVKLTENIIVNYPYFCIADNTRQKMDKKYTLKMNT